MKVPTVRSGVLLIFLFGVVGGASGLTMSLFLQDVLHYTPLQAGLALVPQGVAGFIVSRLSVRVFSFWGIRWALGASFALTAVVIAVVSSLISPVQSYAVLLPCFVVLGGAKSPARSGQPWPRASVSRQRSWGWPVPCVRQASK